MSEPTSVTSNERDITNKLSADYARLRLALLETERVAHEALSDESLAAVETHEFKNFHRLLCERFGYGHDEVDWRRDQLSLIEHIARQLSGECPCPDETSESAWLIEMAGRERAEPLYWHAEPDARCIGGFDPDHNKAMRFCREKDARAMALMLGAQGMIALTDVCRIKITEHAWSSEKATPNDVLNRNRDERFVGHELGSSENGTASDG